MLSQKNDIDQKNDLTTVHEIKNATKPGVLMLVFLYSVHKITMTRNDIFNDLDSGMISQRFLTYFAHHPEG